MRQEAKNVELLRGKICVILKINLTLVYAVEARQIVVAQFGVHSFEK